MQLNQPNEIFDPELFWNESLKISSERDFNRLCLKLYKYQSEHVPVYREFIRLSERTFVPEHYTEIPFLPLRLFRSHVVTDQKTTPALVFSSSGTTGSENSRHYIADAKVYESSFLESFRNFYGSPSDYNFLALLPSYLERNDSSLVYMIRKLMEAGGRSGNGFFLHDHKKLSDTILGLINNNEPIFLIGVTYALIDFFDQYPLQLPSATVVMETGGMKGKRREIIRAEVHEQLRIRTGLQQIHSEYGMTELLSQAYSSGNGLFSTPAWMKVLAGEMHDPFAFAKTGETGVLKIIDLANIHSCAFLETQDLGRVYPDGFDVLGRMDHSEWRGCNLMVE